MWALPRAWLHTGGAGIGALQLAAAVHTGYPAALSACWALLLGARLALVAGFAALMATEEQPGAALLAGLVNVALRLWQPILSIL